MPAVSGNGPANSRQRIAVGIAADRKGVSRIERYTT